MSPHLERAQLLLGQRRHDLAEQQLRTALADDPNEPFAHAMLAICLENQKQLEAAQAEARQAVHLAPDQPYCHYALASVLMEADDLPAAEAAITESIRLDPFDADYYALLAGIRHTRHNWPGALQAAELGLEAYPEHVGCANLRAMTLVQLGRREEAGATIEAALARDPDNAVTHANQGWKLLHERRVPPALEHFREALRLDPELEWARQGMLEALKARQFLYRWMLGYFLWMSRLGPGAQWGVIVGGYILMRVLGSVGKANPSLLPLILPLELLYGLFAILTWTAPHLFNLLLRCDRFGRHLLSPDQTRGANGVGACLTAGLLLFALGLVLGRGVLVLGALGCLALMIPVGGTFNCTGRPRLLRGLYTLGLMGVGLAALALALLHQPLAGTFAVCFLFGLLLFTWLANLIR